jgi:GNAT superfamily N-acetyltransferase
MAITFQLLDLTQEESRNRVGWFFQNEGDRMGSTPMLFDLDRWGQCDEAMVAEEHGEILGVVTLASKGVQNSGRPTLDTLYVPKRHRRNGLGYALFEQGLRRLIERGASDKVFCQLQSSIMLRLVAKLPDDLRGHLQVHEAFRSGDLAEDFEYLEQDLPR